MNRQYIGARYVPKFANPIDWNEELSYEALTIVNYLNNSYTSKKPVTPGNVPNPNSEYWALTGAYNAQVEEYRQKVESYKQEVDVLKEKFYIVPNNITNEEFQELIGKQDLLYMKGNYSLNGTFYLKQEKPNLVIKGDRARLTNRIEFHGGEIAYVAGSINCTGVDFFGCDFTELSSFDMSAFYDCYFRNGIVFKGSRHFVFESCVFRGDYSTPIDTAINIDGSYAFNGDMNFNNCEFVCGKLMHPYVPTPAEPYSEFRGLHFTDCYMYGGNGTQPYINLDSSTLRVIDVFFTGCQFDQIDAPILLRTQGQSTHEKALKGDFHLNHCSCVFSKADKLFMSCDVTFNSIITGCTANGNIDVNGGKQIILTNNIVQDVELNIDNSICEHNVLTSLSVTGTNNITANNITKA